MALTHKYYPENWDEMRAAVRECAMRSVGSDMIWGDQPAPPPDRPFMKIQSFGISEAPAGFTTESNYGVAIIIDTVIDSIVYSVTVDGVAYPVNSGVGATAGSIIALFAAALAALYETAIESVDTLTIVRHVDGHVPSVDTADPNLLLRIVMFSILPIVLSFQVDAFSVAPLGNADSPGFEAVKLLGRARMALESPESTEALTSAGLGFIECSPDRVLNRVMGGGREQHASFDVHLSALSRYTTFLDYIDAFPDTSWELTLTP